DDAPRLLDDRLRPLIVELLHIDDAHAALMAEAPDILVVDGAADADLDRPLGIEQPFLDGATERGAVMEFGAEITVAGGAMSVEMTHAERPLLGDRAEDRQGNGMIAAGGERHGAGRMDVPEDRLDLPMRTLELEGLLDPSIADIADAAERIGVDPG